jgi:hypothetical protein
MKFKPDIDSELAYDLYIALGQLLVDSEYINDDNELDRRFRADQVDYAWDCLDRYRKARNG